ncbi:MAG: sel1 repeat family protein [Campylobacterales bacterium]|nr:sel1 repeat family protein [Campylobacterales bacterium]HEO98333.1 sel1 repeat family protein [Campylobacterota bacterium]
MNQTQKRLSIIKLAISITDIETIQLQISKLRLLRADPRIQRIIDALESESYAQSQILIQEYIDNPIQEVHQRVPEENKKRSYTERELDLIDQFDLFVTNNNEDKEHQIIDIDQYLQSAAAASKKPSEPDLDKLLEMDEEPRKRERHILPQEDPHFFREDTQSESTTQKTDESSEYPYKEEKRWATPAGTAEEEPVEVTAASEEQKPETEAETGTVSQKAAKSSEVQAFSEKTAGTQKSDTNYRPIFSIEQQFHDASQKYPLLVKSTEPYDSVKRWLAQISDEHGYTKSDVENVVHKALKLAQEDSPAQNAEAAELILLCGLTEDEFGQLILARELFKGKFFEKNTSEAYKRIEQLAAKEYPEAICDLAQFYEYGIEAKKNIKRAKALYEKAMHFGIKRALRHFERLNNKGGLLSF